RRKGTKAVETGGSGLVASADANDEAVVVTSTVDQSEQPFQIEVVLPFDEKANPQSGLNFLMGEEDLEDVEAYVTRREDPQAKLLEAEQIIQIQTDMG
ncbi:hypothetical protein A2U01_0073976, partial [Trifolium medium]|nr:hypothetical protein [Trifolium medium]